MYVPRGFEVRRAMELGDLIERAYDQFSSFEEEKPWSLPEPYQLVRELKYSWKPFGSIDKNGVLDEYLDKLRSFGKNKKAEIPIGFVALRKRDAYIIFRGTQTAAEWVNNFNANFVQFFLEGYGAVHEGFQNSYRTFRSQIEEALEVVPKSKTVYVAGHSLGAAFASFACCNIEISLKRKVESLYTYGSPRLGNDIFTESFNRTFGRRSFRIENSSDLVTEIPFPVPFAGLFGGYFSHVETPVLCTVQKNDIEDNHRMSTYLAALRDFDAGRGFWERLLERIS